TYVGMAITAEGTPAANSSPGDDYLSLPHTGPPTRVLLARGGVVFGWGAPVAPEWVGFAVEIGGGGGVVPMSEPVQVGDTTCPPSDICTGWEGYVLRRYQKAVGLGYADARLTMSPWISSGPYFTLDFGVNRNGIPNQLGALFFGASIGYAWGAL